MPWTRVGVTLSAALGSTAVAAPAGILPGDVIMLMTTGESFTTTVPDGFVPVTENGAADEVNIWVKVAGASEPSAYSIASVGASSGLICVVYRGIVALPSFIPTVFSDTTPSATADSVTTTRGNALVLATFSTANGGVSGHTLTANAPFTEVADYVQSRGPIGRGLVLLEYNQVSPGTTPVATGTWAAAVGSSIGMQVAFESSSVTLVSLGMTASFRSRGSPPTPTTSITATAKRGQKIPATAHSIAVSATVVRTRRATAALSMSASATFRTASIVANPTMALSAVASRLAVGRPAAASFSLGLSIERNGRRAQTISLAVLSALSAVSGHASQASSSVSFSCAPNRIGRAPTTLHASSLAATVARDLWFGPTEARWISAMPRGRYSIEVAGQFTNPKIEGRFIP